jgi:hypothetical protein
MSLAHLLVNHSATTVDSGLVLSADSLEKAREHRKTSLRRVRAVRFGVGAIFGIFSAASPADEPG